MYRKILKLNSFSVNQLDIGKITNIAANDLNLVDYQTSFAVSLVIAPFALVGSLIVLWSLVGIASISGVVILFLIIPTQACMANIGSNRLMRKKNSTTDERIRRTNELMEGIRLLKMYGWATRFAETIEKIRIQEMALLFKISCYDYFGDHLLAELSPVLASFTIFVTYWLTDGGTLSADQVYPILVMLTFLRTGLIFGASYGLRLIVSFRLTLKRIVDILESDEVFNDTDESVIRPRQQQESEAFIASRNSRLPLMMMDDDRNAVEFDDFSAFWDQENDKAPALNRVSFSVPRGTLCALIGRVGSGKTTILMSFLNEIPKTTGCLRYSGRIAFAEQEPLIYPGTVRDNILFGRPYDEQRYHQVIQASSLIDDLREFPNGDLTEIGEKGINLSGGQKARTSLARALFSDADIYLLDDPLSAVDSKVAKAIFQNAIRGVLKNKTVILATHQVHFVREAEKIVVLENGEVQGEGIVTDQEQGQQEEDFANITASSFVSGNASNNLNKLPITFIRERISSFVGEPFQSQEIINEILLTKGEEEQAEIEEEEEERRKITERKERKGELTIKEQDGSQIGWGTYWFYLQNVGSFGSFFFFVVTLSILQTFYVMYTYLLRYWIDGAWTPVFSIKVLGCIVMAYFLFLVIREVQFVKISLNVATNLHQKMLRSTVGAVVGFFDANPLGRIMSRFSNDVGVLDRALIYAQNEFLSAAFYYTAAIITMSLIYPWLLIPALLLIVGLIVWVKNFKNLFTQGRGIEIVSSSQILSLLSVSLSGLAPIRVYEQKNRFLRDFMILLNRNVRASRFNNEITRVFVFYTNLVSGIFGCLGLGILILAVNDADTALIGLVCCYLLSFTEYIQYMFRQILNHMTLMPSTVRIKEYIDLQQEAVSTLTPYDTLAIKTKNNWLPKGEIRFNNVYMKYRENTAHALKGFNLVVKPGEKIACVGRTGAGKSSIIQALFRMVEIDRNAASDSSITVDGTDISKIELSMLRKKLSIIPQTSFIFMESIRKNIDPMGEHSDDELTRALQETNLWDYVKLLPEGLDTILNNESSLFSAGQKQLLCIARVILQKNKIVLLDEATAKVDFETDSFIQKMIMEKFQDSTVFTIAHRLFTVVNYDRVVVMDNGRVKELDHPYKLLVKNIGDVNITNKDGIFASMLQKTGTKHSKELFEVAMKNYFKHRQD